MRLSEQDAKARVAKGAALLDEKRPGWFRHVDVGTLQLSSCTQCVLGQLGNATQDGRHLSPAKLIELGLPHCKVEGEWPVVTYGFDVKNVASREDYASLQDAWIAAIADRLIPQVASERPRASQADGLQATHALVLSEVAK